MVLAALALILCGSPGAGAGEDAGVRLTRVTVKGRVLDAEPKWHVRVYGDATYEFMYRHHGKAEYVPGFFVHDVNRGRWLEITEISTEHARLGRAPDPHDVTLQVGWDFRRLGARDYASLPLRTSGSIVFPDRVVFDGAAGLYRLDCNSQLNRDVALTWFWVRKADLDAIR